LKRTLNEANETEATTTEVQAQADQAEADQATQGDQAGDAEPIHDDEITQRADFGNETSTARECGITRNDAYACVQR
jgi:hypothetical protein